MTKFFSYLLILPLVIMFTGCASTYRPIYPQTINYTAHEMKDGVALSYKYDILRERGNKKYAKKEEKKGVKIVAVKVTNNTDSVINLGNDAVFYSGGNQLYPMEPLSVKNTIRQIVPGYLPYIIFTFFNLTVTNSTSIHIYHIGYLLGPALTIGNMAMAGSANANLYRELTEYNIINRDIQKGETVYGIIGIPDMGYNPLSIQLKE